MDRWRELTSIELEQRHDWPNGHRAPDRTSCWEERRDYTPVRFIRVKRFKIICSNSLEIPLR